MAVFRGEVDLTAKKVLAWEPAGGEAMILLEEFLGAMDLALSHPDMQAGLAKRGLTREQVFCLPLTAGAFGLPHEEGRRLMKVPCYVSPSGSNFYAKPIEGLFATVDLRGGEVLEVVDTGVLPLPADDWGYTEAEIAERAGALRPADQPRHPLPARRRQLHDRRQRDRLGHLALPLARRQAPGRGPVADPGQRCRRLALGALPGPPVGGLRPLHGPGHRLVLAHLHGQRRVRLRHLPQPLAQGCRLPGPRRLLPRRGPAGQWRPGRDPRRGLRLRAQHRRSRLAPLRDLRPDPRGPRPRRGPPRHRARPPLGLRGRQLRLPDRLCVPAERHDPDHDRCHRSRCGQGCRRHLDEPTPPPPPRPATAP